MIFNQRIPQPNGHANDTHFHLISKEMNAVLKSARQSQLMIDFSTITQGSKIASKLICDVCNCLPASLKVQICTKCNSNICKRCYDNTVDKIFGDDIVESFENAMPMKL